MESISRAMNNDFSTPWLNPYADLRGDGYVLLAALLREPPTGIIMDILRKLQWESGLPEKLEYALAALRKACLNCPLADVRKEYDGLFVGLGSGEIVPYASWYRDKRMQSAPLAQIRSDLMKSGIIRQSGCHESEDHAGAMCEIMSIFSPMQSGVSLADQAVFFDRHIAPWMPGLFEDLRQAKSSDFYRHVGHFGRRFLETEREFLDLVTCNQKETEKGERKNGNQFFKRPTDVY